jgi:serine/threonine protein kinase
MEGEQEMFQHSFKANIKDKYHFIQKLASGGFGLVYLAEDRSNG